MVYTTEQATVKEFDHKSDSVPMTITFGNEIFLFQFSVQVKFIYKSAIKVLAKLLFRA